MALPIKDTPILTGKDARRFERTIKDNEKKKVSREEYECIMRNYRSIKIVTP